MMDEQLRQSHEVSVLAASHVIHRFHFSKEGLATCACGRWALSKVPMTASRAQQLAKRYGKERFGLQADLILQVGVPFTPLTEEEAVRSWECHIKNLPDDGGKVHGCAFITKRRREQARAIAA